MFYVSVIEYVHVPGPETLGLLTLRGYMDILAGNLSVPLFNSFLYAVVAASIAVSLGLLLAYGASRSSKRVSSFFGFGATVPYTVPGVVMGLAFIWTYIYTPLYGTMCIIILAYVTRYLAIAFRTILAGFSRIHDEIEEAALVYGGKLSRRIGTILAPLLRKDIISAWMLVAGASFVDISMTIFLFNSQTVTVSVAVYNLYLVTSTTDMAALAFVASTGLMLVFTILKKVFHV
jgi:iron(III) transport system permease protein